jgi:predicted N-acetyltransferase YhbS
MAMDGGSGHCLCGAVRFAFDGEPNWQAHCHCESCRRNCAAPFTSYFGISHGKWRWTGGRPATYSSSPGVTRHFCANCGTPMAYQSDEFAHELHFYAATLDDPAPYQPTLHVHWNEHLRWVALDDGLPVRRTPRRLGPEEDAEPVLNLIREAFSYMDGIVDPPSSVHHLTAEGLAEQARRGEVWLVEDPPAPVGSIFLTPKPGRLYIGKLAVAKALRGQGLGRQLLELAETRARALGHTTIELESRVELVGNHAVFARFGYLKTAETAHPGYDRTTSFTFQKRLG